MPVQQRLKGAIDRTIAEEQARQRTAQPASAPTTAAPRRSRSSSTAGTQSPARRPRPSKKASEDLTSRDANADGANPDPAVFEAAFVIDDADDSAAPSRVATPALADMSSKETRAGEASQATPLAADAPTNGTADAPAAGENGEANNAAAAPAAPASVELSPEVRARLRKLDKLEKTYPGS